LLISHPNTAHCCAQHFELLGWVGDSAVTDERLSALLRRAVAYQDARQKWLDTQGHAGTKSASATQEPKFEVFDKPPFTSDGLGPLQASAAPPTDSKDKPARGWGLPAGVEPLWYTVCLLSRCRYGQMLWSTSVLVGGWMGSAEGTPSDVLARQERAFF
jgi:hypothetical protein